MNKSNKWEALSMKDRAFLIRQAVKNGITDLAEVKNLYQESHQFSGEENLAETLTSYSPFSSSPSQTYLRKMTESKIPLRNEFEPASTAEQLLLNQEISGINDITEKVISGEGQFYAPLPAGDGYNIIKAKEKPYYYSVKDKTLSNLPSDMYTLLYSYKDPLNLQALRKELPKKDYIGGKTPALTRAKAAKLIPGFLDSIQATAKRHDINPALLYNRISKEGYLDGLARDYNWANVDEQKNYWQNIADQSVDGFMDFGLDDAGSLLKEGKIRLTKPVSWEELHADNEKGRSVISVLTPTLWDILEIKAGEVERRKGIMKKRGYKDEDLDTWTNAAYNLGEYHKDLRDTNWIKKQYTLPDYTDLFAPAGSSVDANNAHSYSGKEDTIPTVDEYMAQKADSVRMAALNKARNRTELTAPIELVKVDQHAEILDRRKALREDVISWLELAQWRMDKVKNASSLEEGKSALKYAKMAFDRAKEAALEHKSLNTLPESRYRVDTCRGANCIYTVTGDYNRPVSGNYTFRENANKYGFKKIENKDIKPGDIVQFGGARPVHALMANTPYSENRADMRYNGSSGGESEDNIRINATYYGDQPWDDVTAYRYVGNSADSLQWKNEYNQRYGHRFGGDESNDPGFFKSLVNIFKPKPKPAPTSEWPTSYEELPDPIRKIVQNAAAKYNYAYDDIADLYNSGKMNAPLSAVYQYAPSGRVRDNDVAATKEASEDLEKNMNIYMYNVYPKSHGQASPNMAYAIPYLESEEIRVPGVGRVPKNALDSLAKYAAKVKIPLYEAVGLAAQETALGAIPIYNYKAIPKNATEEEKQKVRDYNRALGNSSYFRNYGIIPAEHLVRDFRYNNYPIDRSIPPLEHAFTYWKEGNYNRGDRNHTRDVRAKGRKVMSSDIMKEWAKHSKYAQQALKNNLD